MISLLSVFGFDGTGRPAGRAPRPSNVNYFERAAPGPSLQASGWACSHCLTTSTT